MITFVSRTIFYLLFNRGILISFTGHNTPVKLKVVIMMHCVTATSSFTVHSGLGIFITLATPYPKKIKQTSGNHVSTEIKTKHTALAFFRNL